MVKKLLFISFLLLSCFTKAQCPISVTVTSVPDVTSGLLCKSAAVQLTANPSVGAVGNVSQYVWIIGDDTLLSNLSTVSLLANNQNVLVYMQTTAGCISDTVSTSIQIQTVTMVSVVNPSVIPCNQTVTDIQVSTSGTGTPPYSYDLSTYGTSSGGSYSSVSVGSYTLITTDDNACRDTTEIVVTQEKCRPPSPTDRITPNSDGFNDTWQIFNIEDYPENEVFIFDRWGQRVYHKKGYDNADGWSADYLGLDLPVSTYYYLLEIKPNNGGDEIIMRGPISVFR